MAAIQTAADITGMDTFVSGLLVAFVGINLGFLAYRMSRKAGIR
jgi:hypothetical protein